MVHLVLQAPEPVRRPVPSRPVVEIIGLIVLVQHLARHEQTLLVARPLLGVHACARVRHL